MPSQPMVLQFTDSVLNTPFPQVKLQRSKGLEMISIVGRSPHLQSHLRDDGCIGRPQAGQTPCSMFNAAFLG